MCENHTIPVLETLLLKAHLNCCFISGEKWIENISGELEMKQSLIMVYIDYLGIAQVMCILSLKSLKLE